MPGGAGGSAGNTSDWQNGSSPSESSPYPSHHHIRVTTISESLWPVIGYGHQSRHMHASESPHPSESRYSSGDSGTVRIGIPPETEVEIP